MSKKVIFYSLLLLCLVFMPCKSLSCNNSSTNLWILNDGELSINTKYIDKIPKELIIPNVIDGFEVNSLSSEIFKDCTLLEKVTIPSSITKIGSGAFFGCENLSEVIINGYVVCLPEYVFFNCEKLKIVLLPDSIRYIEDYAFYNCNLLEQISIPKSVVCISSNSFSNWEIFKDYDIQSVIDNFDKEEKFAGFTVNQIIKILGNPSCENKYFIDSNYEYASEIEPNYLKYFSREQLNAGIEIFVFYWEIGDRLIYAWATGNDGLYNVFSSLDCDYRVEF